MRYNLISALHNPFGVPIRIARFMAWRVCWYRWAKSAYLMRSVITRMASEDIGVADPSASCVSAVVSETFYERLDPEGGIGDSRRRCDIRAARNRRAYLALYSGRGRRSETDGVPLPPPINIMNAPHQDDEEIRLMARVTAYDHDARGGSGQNYFLAGWTPQALPTVDARLKGSKRFDYLKSALVAASRENLTFRGVNGEAAV